MKKNVLGWILIISCTCLLCFLVVNSYLKGSYPTLTEGAWIVLYLVPFIIEYTLKGKDRKIRLITFMSTTVVCAVLMALVGQGGAGLLFLLYIVFGFPTLEKMFRKQM